MPIITVRPTIPSYLAILTEGGWVVALAVATTLLLVMLAVAFTRRARHWRT